MDAQQLLHWAYVGCMLLGAAVFWGWSRDPRGVPPYEYAIAMFIPVWSAGAYMAMALGQGKTPVAGQVTHWARYADWLVTTPLLLLALSLTAMFYVKKNPTLIAALMGADVVMILSGLFADLSAPPAARYAWYAVGLVALFVIFRITWGPLRRIASAQGPELGATYTRVAGALTALWVLYPLIWMLGPSGQGIIGQTPETLGFVVVPILSKVGFSLLDLSELRKLGERRPAPGATHPTVHAAGA